MKRRTFFTGLLAAFGLGARPGRSSADSTPLPAPGLNPAVVWFTSLDEGETHYSRGREYLAETLDAARLAREIRQDIERVASVYSDSCAEPGPGATTMAQRVGLPVHFFDTGTRGSAMFCADWWGLRRVAPKGPLSLRFPEAQRVALERVVIDLLSHAR